MRSLHPIKTSEKGLLATLGKFLLLLPVVAFTHIPVAEAQLLNPLQVSEPGLQCPGDSPDAPNNFTCTSNDINLTLVELTNLVSCTEGDTVSATFDIDLEVNANIRYNPIIWIGQNGIDPRNTGDGGMCFASSVPDGPLTHIPELFFSDANDCADIDVPSNNFTLADLVIGPIDFLCQDTDNDGKAEIPILVTWNNSGGAACEAGVYPINSTPSKCDAFTAESDIDVVNEPGIQLSKAGTLNDDDGTPGVSAGDSITYAFTVENTGTVTLTNVTLSDPSLTSVSGGPIASLAPGATDSTTFTGTYIITQADIDSGSFSNTATVNSNEGVDDTAIFIQPLAQDPLVGLDKSGTLNDDDGTPGVSAGDTISYVFSITNTGNTTLTNIVITDPDATVTGGPLASLAPGVTDNTTFTGVYTITQADIDAGTFTNTATVLSDQATDQDSDTQPLARNPDYTLVKTATPQTYSSAGQVISYSFLFTNSGNVTLSAPYTIDDDTATDEACPGTPASLLPGESVTCTATYTTTQQDVDDGSVTNIASGTALDPDGATVTSNTDTETVTAVLTGTLNLVKTATPQTYNTLGQVISYSYLLTNSTNLTLSAPYTIDDDKAADENCPGTPASLAPGESVTCTASYTITQADLDAGSVTNVATGTAQDPSDQTVTSNQDDETVRANVTGSLGLVKTATPQTYSTVGQVISYSFELTNNFNVTVFAPYAIDDDISTDENCPATPVSLAPGESVTCTASYTITQADLDNGSVTNVATGTATDGDGGTVTSNPDTETVTVNVTGALLLVKTATPQTYNTVGQVISYSFELTNDTNVTLFAPYTIADDKSVDENCPATPASLAPGDSVTCTASYTITQADIDAGSVTNLATGTAQDGDGGTVASNQDTETVTAQVTGSLSLVKTATPQTYSTVGDNISYSYLLTNNTNVTLFAPYTIADDKSTDENCPATPVSLAPGDSVTCTASYTITQGDIDAGSVTNVATGTAQDGDGGTVASNQDSETVDVVVSGTLLLQKTATPQTYNTVGQVIAYSYVLTNNTNITLSTPYTIDDDKSTDEACPGTPANLAPGESVTCSATYTITQADLDAGSVTNVAIGTASDGEGTVTSNQDTETISAEVTGALNLVKTATPPTYNTVGQVISYSYQLANNTNVTLFAPYTIADDKSTDENCPATPASLAPGDSVTCTASYTITQDDLDAGSVTNVATGTAQNGAGGTVTSNQDTETVSAEVTGALNLVKSATPQTYTTVGDVISYSFELTNNTNVTLFAPYTIDDDTSTDENCPATPASLAPGASVTCTASYTITQTDLDDGSVTNVATGTAQDGDGGTVTSNQDTETVSASITGSLTLEKTATPQTYNAVGNVISYSYVLTNGTNVTLFAPYAIDDDTSTDESCPATPASLAPGDSVTCTASHTIIQADLDAGSVTNVATGTARDAAGGTVTSNQDSETVNAILINLAKSAAAPTYDAATGRYTVVYTITASNAGTTGGTYDLTDTFAPATGITLFSATIAYGGGETQTGTPAGPLPYTFTSGETVVTDEGLGGGATETWTVTGIFDVDPSQVTADSRACVVGQEQRGQGFYNTVSGVDSESDTTDNDACTNLPDPIIDLVKTAGEPEFSNGVFTVIYTVTANNLGDGPGFYDLTDSLQPGDGISVAQAQLTAYNAGTENSRTGTLAGPLPYTFTSPATLVTDEALAGGRNESWTIEVQFEVAFGEINDTFLCSEGNSGPGTGFYNEVRGSDSDPDETNDNDCVDPTGGDALFRVTKDFTDDNTMGVRVHLACNNGNPTEQSFNISEFGLFRSVTFVMTNFTPGAMDCTVTELPVPDGYSESYDAPLDVPGIAAEISADELGCHYEDVLGGLFECHITNTPDPVDVVVDKVWEVFEQGGNVFSLETDINIFCDGEMPQGTQMGDTGIWWYSENIVGNDTVATTVIPRFPFSRCWATESIFESYIDIDNQCGDSFETAAMSVAAGSGDQCTIINTVFFEGIPTLNRYGLMLLTLLMLGVGAIGFRRFT